MWTQEELVRLRIAERLREAEAARLAEAARRSWAGDSQDRQVRRLPPRPEITPTGEEARAIRSGLNRWRTAR